MMKTTKHTVSRGILLAMVIVALCQIHSFGQKKPYNEEITVIAAFDPIIPDAFKISQNPLLNDTNTTVPVMTYKIIPRNAGIQLDIDPLPPVKLVAEPLSKIYRNYLKAGFGNYTAIYGELFASSLRSKTQLFGVHLKHLSYSGKIRDYAPSQNSSQLAEVFGEKYFENHTLSGKLFFNREGLHQYGYELDSLYSEINKKDIEQHFMTGGGNVNLVSRYKSDDKLNHTIGISYYHLADNYRVKENNFNLGTDLNKQLDLFGLPNPQVLGVNASVNFLNQKDSVHSINATVVDLNPYLKFSYNEYSFKAGLAFYVAADTLTKGHLYPQLEANIDLIPGSLQLYAGIDGSMERNSIRSLSQVNPYISSGLNLNYSYNKFRAYGGFTSNISRSFNFNGSISSITFENYPFFISDTLAILMNTFNLVYDDITLLKLRAEVEYVKAEKIRISLAGQYYNYKTGEQEYAWYKPDFDLALDATYAIQQKIFLKLKAQYTGAVWGLAPNRLPSGILVEGEPTLKAKKIDGWLDLSVGTDYHFNKALTFWLNVNNVTNQRHFSWANYPSYKINLMAGMSYSF